MDPQELVPLESPFSRPRPHRQQSYVASRSCYKGPIRLCRFLILMTLLPCVFVVVPLYMRYRVFSGQMYPMSMTDMRLIDSKISPTWCQRQVVKSNTTFNAFVVPGPPEMTQDLVNVSMTRELELEDDMKEYWGFYLLKGSSVTVSACVRWPGASLIMIKGYKHLQECAYIGDDSSEELSELLEANRQGLLSNTTLWEKIQELNRVEGKINDPGTMKRHKAGVSFHDPSHATNVTASDNIPAVDVTDHDSKELRAILEHLHAVKEAAKAEAQKHYHPPSHLMSLPALHRHRDANVDIDERRWLSFKDIDGNISEQKAENNSVVKDALSKDTLSNVIKKLTNITHIANNKDNAYDTKFYHKDNIEKEVVGIATARKDKEDSVVKATTEAFSTTTKEIAPNRTKAAVISTITKEKILNNELNMRQETPSSKEVFEGVLNQLQQLGDRGKRVLMRLHKSMGVTYNEEPSIDTANIMSAVTGSEEELDHLRQVLVEAIDEEKTRSQRQQRRRDTNKDARAKRELMLGQIDLKKEFNEDDEARDYAAEEGLEPDGYADHHIHLNETTAFDMSGSEFWSSFSSSEEALLECAGLILNLPLTPHASCQPDASAGATDAASKANALTYRVPANGYYFFVFNSENEVQTNFIRARFELQKTRYEVARAALRGCTNATRRCDLPLDFFSTQKVVLEVPLRNNDSLWNEQFVVLSECEPRTALYLACALALPVLILACAFT